MTRNEKRAYLDEIRKRYWKSSKAKRSAILDEFCEVCGYNRKYAIRKINEVPKARRQKTGPISEYQQAEVLEPLRVIWLKSDQMCSKKLKAALPLWLPFYESRYCSLPDTVRQKLLKISAPTIDRVLKPIKASFVRKGLSGTKPGSILKQHIPIKTDHWDVKKPGFVEADTVAHCGNSMAGSFAWSLTVTDIASTWTENRAVWNKGAEGVVTQIQDIEQSVPFSLLGFDSDNGNEFLNHHLWRYFANRERPVQFTRSRPYHKNDNAHVEQKNWSHVRQLLGYDRFERIELVELMNDLYKNEWSLYQNHFCPSSKLISKEKIGSKYRKKYSIPMTPYQRILESEAISDEVKASLRAKHSLLNPFTLKQQIEVKLKRIFALVTVTTNVRQRI